MLHDDFEKEELLNDRKLLTAWQKNIEETDNKRMEEIIDQFIDINKKYMTMEVSDWFIRFLEFYKVHK